MESLGARVQEILAHTGMSEEQLAELFRLRGAPSRDRGLDASVLVAEVLMRRGRELSSRPDLRLVLAEHQWNETAPELDNLWIPSAIAAGGEVYTRAGYRAEWIVEILNAWSRCQHWYDPMAWPYHAFPAARRRLLTCSPKIGCPNTSCVQAPIPKSWLA